MEEARPGAVSRRSLLQRALAGAAGLGALSVIGCGDSRSSTPATRSSTVPATAATEKTSSAPTVSSKSEWSVVPGAGAPSARRDHTMTADPERGLIYLFGGRLSGASMNDLWSFDPTNATWREIPTSATRPSARFAQVAIYDRPKKRLIIATGQGDGGAFFNDVWAFDPLSVSWSELGSATTDRPEIRYGAGGAHDESGNRLFISHGFTDHGRFDDTWTFDLGSERWAKIATGGALPIKRCLTRCMWLPGTKALLLFGGQTDDTPFLGDLWSLDVASGRWDQKASNSSPGPRNLYGAAADASSAHWYIFGGNTPGGPANDTWVYDVAASTWAQIQVDAAPAARYSADASIANGRLYVVGGNDGNIEIGDQWSLPLGI